MRTEVPFMTARKPDVSAEFVLGLLASQACSQRHNLKTRIISNKVMCYLPVCSCTKLSFLLR
jgi:hypothetical protein